MIKTEIRTENDMVMVFDESGEEMPEYQGNYDGVRDKIMLEAGENSVFSHWLGYRLEPRVVEPNCF